MKKRCKVMIVTCSAFLLISGSAVAMTSLPQIYINNEEYANSYGKLKIEKGTAMISLRTMVQLFKGEVTYKDHGIYITLPEATHLARQVDGLMRGLVATTPEEAANTWIRGVQRRSGPTQYAVMTSELQKKTKQEFEDHSWVTGGSSPHMGTVTKMDLKTLSADKVQISFAYPLVVPADGTIDYGKAVLTIVKAGDPEYWAISEISLQDPGDTGLMMGANLID
ncbi:hypothetical protein [Paenibacillus sp. Marseille-Q7038]